MSPAVLDSTDGWTDFKHGQQEELSSSLEVERTVVSHGVEDGLLNLVSETIHAYPEVVGVYASRDEKVVHFWTVIETRNLDLVRNLIKGFQQKVSDLFVNTEHRPFDVDFHIYYREGQDPVNLLPDSAIPIS